MNKELFVSTTPHETKVGITEDDQLAEIYLERENEYTLAGSIYKGRVTRVLPGMQSAFVDIGLERDAFLYVSDFMDLEQQDEDLDEADPGESSGDRGASAQRFRSRLVQRLNNDGQFAEAGSVADEGKSRKRFLRKRRATSRARARRAIFADAAAVADVVERSGAGRVRSAASVRSAAKFAANRATRFKAKHATKCTVRLAANRGTNHDHESRNDRFSRGDRPGRSGSDSRFQRPAPSSPAPVAITITDRLRDINRSCFPANRSRSTSARVRVRIRAPALPAEMRQGRSSAASASALHRSELSRR